MIILHICSVNCWVILQFGHLIAFLYRQLRKLEYRISMLNNFNFLIHITCEY